MKSEYHPSRERLIDFVEGEVTSEEARQIDTHVQGCAACSAYVESLRRICEALAEDAVPEPPAAYWAYLAGRARQRARSTRRRLVLGLVPGLAAAAVLVIVLWWLPRGAVAPIDRIELILADMSTTEILQTVSESPYIESMLLGSAETEIGDLEAYLIQTGSIFELLDGLSSAESQHLTSVIEESMAEDGGTSGITNDATRKGC
jgi:predicted anti-sigma-YlaC factor YlaD